jgi:A/G-specific adenine glycosylase
LKLCFKKDIHRKRSFQLFCPKQELGTEITFDILTNKEFRSQLLSWYDVNKRSMPWREVDNPYFVWVSEIMLQQTRVDQVEPYFRRFIERFPTVYALAEASQQEVLAVWEGLGYYSGARHLHSAAQTVVEEYNGKVPDNWDEITKLKGIGPYTAAALLSIAYQKPHAVVDGNVIRVLSRWFGIEDDVRRSSTKNDIQACADELLDKERPGDFNQALMELGALVCTPADPNCGECPLEAGCTAYRQVKTEAIPYKSPAKKVPHHNIGVGILINEREEVLIALRPEEAMLVGLWEFPGGKQEENETIRETIVRELKEELGIKAEIIEPFMQLKHAYSHFKITLHASICKLAEGKPAPKTSQEIKWIPIEQLDAFPFPKANRQLTDKLMSKEFLQRELNL